jgi:NAD(P)-dependent dehydrogenase (short-subunit alcohol dehydrogenase family)
LSEKYHFGVLMKTIVITGSTRGIGYSLAHAFLKKGCRVVISGRKQGLVDTAIKNLRDEFSVEHVAGFSCDVTIFPQVEKLWEKSAKIFGPLDIWINNAGISNTQNPPWELSAEEIENVVKTNMIGEMFGTKVAISGFIEQGFGALYNMEGMGAQGRRGVKGLSIYGATKVGLRYFNDSIISEIGSQRIIIGAIQPGMMLTEMVTGQYANKPEEWEKVKNILGMISEKPAIVADWLAEKIISNNKNGVRFRYGGIVRIASRMIKNQFQK